ncbi:MAG: hypothetical protein LBJ23_05420 [Tannerella sp.]|jgi:anti-sigma-K factor RskA|nr:hypothetical protein [Tannerella sp.]
MKQMDIQQLLEKYYAGETAPEEERRLEDYFLSDGSTDERREKDRKLFRALHEASREVPKGVSARLEATLRRLEESGQPFRTHTLWRWAGSAAAVAILCAGIFFATRSDMRQPAVADTYDNPEEAALMAEKTLRYVSDKLNKGLEQTYVVEHEMGKMNEVIEKTFKTNN